MVTRIALTGGPCAGKSTVLKRIRQKYEDKGYAVYLLPESATLFIEAGADFLTKNADLSFVTEKSKLEFQLQTTERLLLGQRQIGMRVLHQVGQLRKKQFLM